MSARADDARAPGPPGPATTAAEMAALVTILNESAERLAATHASLHAEVQRLRDELSEANRQVQRSKHLAMLGEMAAGIAHEVRNPLGSIGLYARMLCADLADRPAARGTAEKIAGAVGRLEGVVSQVLAFSRELRVRHEVVPAGELFDAALEACRDQAEPWPTLGVSAPGPRDGVPVRCDPALMHRALVNLIGNALAAVRGECGTPSPEPPTLHLHAARVRVLGPDGRSEAMVRLRVRDSGPGMSLEVARRVFQPFFTTRAQGTGLGLAIVHRIVDAHGGRVAVTGRASGLAEPGPSGAAIDVLLPDHVSSDAEDPAAAGRPTARH